MMKSYITMILVLAAITSCTQTEMYDNNQQQANPGIQVQFFAADSIPEIVTRASGNQWDAGDAVGIFATKAGQAISADYPDKAVNKHFTIADVLTGTMSPVEGNEIYYPANGDKLDFFAYYPYKSEVTGNSYKVDVTQNQSDPTKIDLLWTKASNQSLENIALRFKHKLTKVTLNLSLSKPSVDLTGATAKLKGMYSTADFDLETGTFSRKAVADIPVDITVDKNNKSQAVITALVVPNETGAQKGRMLELIIDGKITTYPIEVSTWESGKSYSYDIVNKYFPDANFRNALKWLYQIVEENGDIDPENATNKSILASISELYVTSGKGITSLKGIEYFTALTVLNCAQNDLTVLDLSKNVLLERLYCSKNKLSALYLPKTTTLTVLNCEKNEFTVLDLSANTALHTLNCFSNQLSALNLLNNTALTTINCSSNQLSTLNLSTNTALVTLDCSINQLSTLDLSTNVLLETLDCAENQLLELEVSENRLLKKLDCYRNFHIKTLDVSNNSVLTYLRCNDNKLSALDVSGNTALSFLSCERNQLSELKLPKSDSLIYLYCHNNKLSILDVSGNSALSTLESSYNQLSSLDISKNTELYRFTCSNNRLTTLDIHLHTKLSLSFLSCGEQSGTLTLTLNSSQNINWESGNRDLFNPNVRRIVK